jgi:hypothetical protein
MSDLFPRIFSNPWKVRNPRRAERLCWAPAELRGRGGLLTSEESKGSESFDPRAETSEASFNLRLAPDQTTPIPLIFAFLLYSSFLTKKGIYFTLFFCTRSRGVSSSDSKMMLLFQQREVW